MAHPKHLRILKQGIDFWNKWRFENRNALIDLWCADLSNTDLTGAHLSGAKLGYANLSGADLSSAGLSGASLSGADLSSAKLCYTDLSNAKITSTKLTSADLTCANLRDSDMTGSDFSRATLSRASLSGASLSKAKFINADFSEAILSRVNFSGADLTGASFSGADLTGADLSNVNLRNVSLAGANISRAKFLHANLSFTVFLRTYAAAADFTNSEANRTVFADFDMSTITGLDKVLHRGPSTLGIDTLFLSQGKIPETFLIGCGVPEDLIAYIPSLIGAAKSIQFYSCFISYSTNDAEFAHRLFSRMRDVKLRVWFAPEDMKAGEKIFDQIDLAIQQQDRLLLVLSDDNMKSPWVITEIRKAFKVEQMERRRKLFPIRLVKFDRIKEWELPDADSGHDLASEIRSYFIPDFSNWKDHDSFEQAFKRLLQDLRAAEK